MTEPRTRLTQWLASQSVAAQSVFAVSAAFSTYFCMYAFRKPFAAATLDGEPVELANYEIGQKTLFVVAQIIGYALSKYVGVKVCSEAGRNRRFPMLVGLILAAELALVLFGVFPSDSPLLKMLAIFANGLPLGMVWGLVVLYLEGRRVSELLLAGLSCSYIVASGFVKDVGRALLAGNPLTIFGGAESAFAIPNPIPPVSDFWMPAITGVLFLPPFLISAWLLEQVPNPDAEDRAARVERAPMTRRERWLFVRRHGVGITASLVAFFVLTAFRDYRDNYMVDAFSQLGYDAESHGAILSRAELLVAFGVMAILSQLFRIKDNRHALIALHAVMAGGLLLVGVSTWLLDTGHLSGFWWMTLIGFGAYLAYVPFGAMLFDRVIASTGYVGTAVFGIYLADAIGYTGSVAIQLGKDVAMGQGSQLDFLRTLSYTLALIGVACLGISGWAFTRRPLVVASEQLSA